MHMCGRSSLTLTEKELEKHFNASFYSDELERYNPLPNFNVAPSHVMPIIRSDDMHHFRPHRWGLIPFWAKDENIGYKMINARSETVLQKNAFKKAMSQRRCLVPMDGYYEWQKQGKNKIPFRIQTKDQKAFMAAGLWERWKSPDGKEVYSFTILTQNASHGIAHIHDRMPAILKKEDQMHWVDMDIKPEDVLSIVQPYPDELLHFYQVSNEVNKVSNNRQDLIEEAKPPEGEQLSLL